ncbi:MAG: hypothetical protein SVP52_04045 [Chloroflexota bacterium]|nr:hypothetical protein [Chloroflexota bacterium]
MAMPFGLRRIKPQAMFFYLWLSCGRSEVGTVNPSGDYGMLSFALLRHEVFPLKLGSLKAALRDVGYSLQSPECGPCLEYNGTPLGAELEKREGQPAETWLR